jgi:WD40 repeat protein
VAFSHDSARLASASDDSTVKIWDASSGACFQTLEGHSRSVNSVAFSHDSTRLASASDDSTVKIWDASSGACYAAEAVEDDDTSSPGCGWFVDKKPLVLSHFRIARDELTHRWHAIKTKVNLVFAIVCRNSQPPSAFHL